MSAASNQSPQPVPSVLERVDSLRKQLAGLVDLQQTDEQSLSTGCRELDQLLPGGCLRAGMLIECLTEGQGSGATTLAMHIAKQLVTADGGSLVVADRWRRFYPPAAVARGIESRNLIVVRSSDTKIMSAQEELWALDQALRCPAVSVVMAWIDKIDPRAFRRLQLAAEAGGTVALLIRSDSVHGQPTWSDVQLLVRSLSSVTMGAEYHQENRFFQVELLRQRGRAGSSTLEGTSVKLEIDELDGTLKGVSRRHESRTLHMAPRVAHSATRRRSAGA